MATVPALTDRAETQRWAAVRDEEGLWGDLRPELLEAVRTILETTMEDGLTAELVAARYQRTPSGTTSIWASTEVYLHVGRYQAEFIEVFGKEVLPELRLS